MNPDEETTQLPNPAPAPVENLETDVELLAYASKIRMAAQRQLDAYQSSQAILREGDVNGYIESLQADPTKIYNVDGKRLTALDLLKSLSTDEVVRRYVETPNPENPIIVNEAPLKTIARVAMRGAFQ